MTSSSFDFFDSEVPELSTSGVDFADFLTSEALNDFASDSASVSTNETQTTSVLTLP
jgi:hypothetical protein